MPKFYKTKITATVISTKPLSGIEATDQLCEAIEDDDAVICTPAVLESSEVTPADAAKFMEENQKDPGWFGLTPDGSPIETDDEFAV